MNPTVSVIVAVYNVEPYLSRCAESLASQTMREFEVILVDDGSTDSSGVMCEELARTDARFRAVHQNNGGLSDARNAGLAVARGEYVVFIDGDDWVEPTLLEDLLRAAVELSADVVVAGSIVDVEDDRGNLLSSSRREPAEQVLKPGAARVKLERQLLGLLGYAWNKLYRRELLAEHSLVFETGLSLVEDVVFNAQVVQVANRIAVISAAHVHYVQRQRQTLGAKHYDDFLMLRLRAVDSLDSMLCHWGVPAGQRATLLAPLLQAAVRNLVRRAVQHHDWSLRAQAKHLKEVAGSIDPKTRMELVSRGNGPFIAQLYSAVFFLSPKLLFVVLEHLRLKIREFGETVREAIK